MHLLNDVEFIESSVLLSGNAAHYWTRHRSSPEAMSDSPEWILPEARGSDGPPLNCLMLLREHLKAFIIAQCWFRLGPVPVALSTVMGWKWDFEKFHIQHPSRSLQLIDVTPVLRRAWGKKGHNFPSRLRPSAENILSAVKTAVSTVQPYSYVLWTSKRKHFHSL